MMKTQFFGGENVSIFRKLDVIRHTADICLCRKQKTELLLTFGNARNIKKLHTLTEADADIILTGMPFLIDDCFKQGFNKFISIF